MEFLQLLCESILPSGLWGGPSPPAITKRLGLETAAQKGM